MNTLPRVPCAVKRDRRSSFTCTDRARKLQRRAAMRAFAVV
jgi:hypothetical protein